MDQNFNPIDNQEPTETTPSNSNIQPTNIAVPYTENEKSLMNIEPNIPNKKSVIKSILIIVIILLLAAAGAGAYLWRDKTANDSASKQSATINSQKTTIATLNIKNAQLTTAIVKPVIGTTSATTLQSVSIPEWGIKGYYYFSPLQSPSLSNKDTLTYSIKNNSLAFNSADTINTCSGNSGYISRYTADQKIVVGSAGSGENMAEYFKKISADNEDHISIWHIGSYYYYINLPQAPCSTNITSVKTASEEVGNETIQFFASMRAI